MTLPARFAAYLETFADPPGDVMRRVYPGLSAPHHVPVRAIPLAVDLERHAAEILAEFRAADLRGFAPEVEPIRRTGAWDVLFLYERHIRHDDTCAMFPRLVELMERHRTVRGLAGMAYLSRLAAGSRVALHRGPTNLRLRVHFGLQVPSGCGLIVADHTLRWDVGKALILNDFLPHAVYNESDEDRIVLVVDVWHPELSPREIGLLTGLHAYAEAHARNLTAYAEHNACSRRS